MKSFSYVFSEEEAVLFKNYQFPLVINLNNLVFASRPSGGRIDFSMTMSDSRHITVEINEHA